MIIQFWPKHGIFPFFLFLNHLFWFDIRSFRFFVLFHTFSLLHLNLAIFQLTPAMNIAFALSKIIAIVLIRILILQFLENLIKFVTVYSIIKYYRFLWCFFIQFWRIQIKWSIFQLVFIANIYDYTLFYALQSIRFLLYFTIMTKLHRNKCTNIYCFLLFFFLIKLWLTPGTRASVNNYK